MQSIAEPDTSQPAGQIPKPRWYRPTPDRLLIALLPILGLLLLSEQFRWFPFNEHKNWTVLIAVAVVLGAVVLLLLWFGVGLIFRRCFQFSIRSLMLFVVVVAVVCSWFTVKMQQAARQTEVIVAIEKAGGHTWYDYEFDANGKFQWPPRRRKPPGLPWLRDLHGVDFLSDVELVECVETTELRLVHLKVLTRLRDLYLQGTWVADGGVVYLNELTSLQRLMLNDTQVSDAGLMHLKGLRSLEELWLDRSQVTDAGLMHLKGLTNLQHLRLCRTQVSDAGVQDLQKALPNCRIDR